MGGPLRLYPGVSYRHCLVWSGFEGKPDLTPPHDISEKKVGKYLPKGEGSEVLLDLMKKSYPLLSEHFVNRERQRGAFGPAPPVVLGTGKASQSP